MRRHEPVLLTFPDFLSPDACRAEIERAEAIGFAPAPITTGGGFVMMPDVRNNTRVMRDDTALAERLFAALAPRLEARGASLDAASASSSGFRGVHGAEPRVEGACTRPVGLNERFRYYKYGPTECFRWHHDGSFRRPNGEASELTFMVYLNEGFEGGATEFEDCSVQPRAGMAIVFTHRVRHQGAPVVSGTKYVLRSDVMFRRDAA